MQSSGAPTSAVNAANGNYKVNATTNLPKQSVNVSGMQSGGAPTSAINGASGKSVSSIPTTQLPNNNNQNNLNTNNKSKVSLELKGVGTDLKLKGLK